MLYNVMEGIVEEALDSILMNFDCCKCNKCRNDIMAIALNNLKPHYVSSGMGELISRSGIQLWAQEETDVLAKLAAAAEHVKNHPRHIKEK